MEQIRIEQPKPAISIGMPVYNGEMTVQAAIDSLLSQTFEDFELIISDNASTDRTEAICREYAAKDSRIRYVRQSINIGASKNFRYVLLNSVAPYFMWAAADDTRSPDFLAINFAFLTDHTDYLGSTSPVRFVGEDFDEWRMGDASLDDDDRHARITRQFGNWHANGRFYSLFRREPVREWVELDSADFLGGDWTLITYLAVKGKLNRLSEGWVELGRNGVSNRTDTFARYRRSWLDWLFPFKSLTANTMAHMRGARPSYLIRASLKLLRLNVQAFKTQFHAMRHRERPEI